MLWCFHNHLSWVALAAFQSAFVDIVPGHISDDVNNHECS